VQRVLWFILILVGPLAGCYVTGQALHQNDLFNTRRKVSLVLASPQTPLKTKDQLTKVRLVLAYAEAQGLNTAGAYGYLIETQQPVVSYLVQAAKDDQLSFITWWFPLVGEVPYLGFFGQDERNAEAARLKALGYDVSTGGAGAFSSLGWFDDPIFSSMLERGDAELAHLFFHELTHRTLWVAGAPTFNENLAEFTALVLTREYLASQGNAVALAQLTHYERKQRDKQLFTVWLQTLKADLTDIYQDKQKLGRTQVLEQKRKLLQKYQTPPLKPAFSVVDYVGKESWNNASVLGASLYAPDIVRFAKAYGCLGAQRSIRRYLAALRVAVDLGFDPFMGLDGLCRPLEHTVGEEHADVDR